MTISKSITKSKSKNVKNKDREKLKCPMCGELKVYSNYYQSKSPLYQGSKDKSGNNLMVFCKNCIAELYDQYFAITQDVRSSIYIACLKFDIPFSEGEFEGVLKEKLKKPSTNAMRIYMTKLNSLGNFNSEMSGFDPIGLLEQNNNQGKTIDNTPKNKEPELVDFREIERNIELTEEDLNVKSDVIRLIGYDPFAGYSKFDQKFLYNELIPYLDEDTLDDAFKLSQITQLVNNNNQIRKIDLVIASMSADTKTLISNHGDIKSLSQTKNTIVQSTDKIAKENSISVKNRGDKTAGKSTLTYMMRQYRELGFEDAEQDYYDQNKAYGMKVTADISNKSLLEQLQFDENDYTDMLTQQRELIEELQSKVEDLEEQNRQLHVEIDNYKKK